MSPLKTSVLLVLMACAFACGRQVVDFSLDANGNAPVDARADAGVDAAVAVAPTVTSTLPVDHAIGIALNSRISATFSTSMNAASITTTTFRVKQGATNVAGAVLLDAAARTATFTPGAVLGASLVYTVTITTGARDVAGLPLAANYSWSFTTAANANPPIVSSTSPPDSAVNVSVNKQLTATFSKGMDPATITAQTFTVKQGATAVLGSVSLDGATNTARFSPTGPLGEGLVYTATITTGAKDTGGTALVAPYTWGFTTGACSQAPVALRSTAGFVVLAGSTVTNTGPTSITGDLGVSPGTAVTGFPPGTVVGRIHAGDPAAAQAIADLTLAYNDAAIRTLCAVTVAGNLGGQTLAPGLYKSTSSLAISAGDLTLDAQGDGDAVFIFQMASTLTTTSGRQVILANGAKAANIYWQVGTSATFGTTSDFQGTVMANQSITLETGASLDGRVLARIGAAALDSNTIVKPAP